MEENCTNENLSNTTTDHYLTVLSRLHLTGFEKPMVEIVSYTGLEIILHNFYFIT